MTFRVKHHNFLTIAFGSIIVILAILAYFGWRLDVTELSSFGKRLIPMAPSTSLLFLIYGTIMISIPFAVNSTKKRMVLLIANWLAITASIVMLLLSWLGVRWTGEHLGMGISGALNGIPLGYMSIATAGGFIFAGIALFFTFSLSIRRKYKRVPALITTFIILTATIVLLLGYLYGEPLLYGTATIPPALSTVLAFLFLGFGLLAAVNIQKEPVPEEDQLPGIPGQLVMVFCILTFAIIGTGYYYYSNYEKHYREEVERTLQSVSTLKSNNLWQWRMDHLLVGQMLGNNQTFTALAERFFRNPEDVHTRRELRNWLGIYDQMDELHAVLTDANGMQVLPAELDPGVPPSLRYRIPAAIQRGRVALLDFYRSEADGKVYIATVVPLFSPSNSSEKMGAVVLVIDPAMYFDILIQSWPSENESAETLLVRRDGDEAVYLNNPRSEPGTALRRKEPITNIHLPEVQAVMGFEGIVTGTDQHGISVIADVRSVKDSPWFIVVCLNQDEIFANLRDRLWFIVMLIVVLLFSSASGLGLIWRQQRVHFYRDRYLALEALEESERRLRNAEAVGHLGNWLLDLETGRQSWSDEMYRIYGVDKTAFSPSLDTVRKRIHPEDVSVYDQIPAIYFSGEEVEQEYRIIRQGGEVRHVFVKGILSRNAQDKPVSIYGTTLDTTDIKQKERKLQDTNDELARFTYTVSHDLKSPLVTVKTFLGYLEKDTQNNDTERVSADMNYIRTAIDKMGRLLEELLEMSRLGRIVNPRERVSYHELTKEALGLVAGPIASNDATVTIDEKDCYLHVDRPRMVEVMQNLIENAIKYRKPSEPPHIEVGIQNETGEPVFYVKDNGIGIDPRFSGKVFGLFEKLDSSSEGTGLGLALVKRIVELHGGKIWLESEGVGHGSCFYFTLTDALDEP